MNGQFSVMQGVFVAMVGPSGSGKDTLIRLAREQLKDEPRVHFVRRSVTRPIDGSEDHEPISRDEFADRVTNDIFGLHWQAHGLCYGLPNSELQWLGLGHVVIANVSRTMQAEVTLRFPRHLFVEIAANEEIRAARIGERKRASDGDPLHRLSRTVTFQRTDRTVVIENNDEAEIVGKALVHAIRGCLLPA